MPSYAARLWQFPIDETHCMIVRFLSFRARNEAERAIAKKTFEEVAVQRLQKVNEEDAWAAKAQGDLVTARNTEFLLGPDEDVVKVRRMIATAFVSQHTGGVRHAVKAGALDCPV